MVIMSLYAVAIFDQWIKGGESLEIYAPSL